MLELTALMVAKTKEKIYVRPEEIEFVRNTNDRTCFVGMKSGVLLHIDKTAEDLILLIPSRC